MVFEHRRVVIHPEYDKYPALWFIFQSPAPGHTNKVWKDNWDIISYKRIAHDTCRSVSIIFTYKGCLLFIIVYYTNKNIKV